MQRDSPVMIRQTDSLTASACFRNSASISFPTKRNVFLKFARMAGISLSSPPTLRSLSQRLDSIATIVQKRGGEAVFGITDGVPDQADTEGPALECAFIFGRVDRDGQVGLVRGNEIVKGRINLVFDAEHEVAPALLMGEDHGEGVIAAVIHDDIALRAVLKVGESGQPLVLVGEQREVDRDPIVEPVEDAEHALGIVGAIGDAVATVREVPRQGELGAVGGENPMAFP